MAPPGPGEVAVDLAACAICHSDIMYIDGGWGGSLPAVYGHEASGIVSATGEGVKSVKVGDHVVVTLIRSCGQCHYCSQGHQVACETTFQLDEKSPLTEAGGTPLTHGLRTGAFAEKVTVHASQVVAIDKSVPLDAASLLACGVLTGFGAVANTANIETGATIAVIGTGGVGLNSVQAGALCGASQIIAIDVSDKKLDAARQFGATHTIDARGGAVADKVRTATSGRGVDYAFVTVGAKPAINDAPHLISATGCVVIVGMPATGVMAEYDPGSLAAMSQKIIGSKMGSGRVRVDIPYLVELYKQGRLKLDELITGRYRLDDINDAIASTRSGDALRNVIIFERA